MQSSLTGKARFLLSAALLFSAVSSGFGQTAAEDQAKVGQAESPLVSIVKKNELQGESKHPFHLKLSFQLFDLLGKAEEQGTLEYWWAAEVGSHLDITSPSLSSLHEVRFDVLPNIATRRRLYLASELLNAMRAPAESAAYYTGQAVANNRSSGDYKLKCLQVGQSTGEINVCTGEVGTAIRMVSRPDYLLVRNAIGRFAATDVALDEVIYLAGKMAIKGHIDKLESFDPTQHPGFLDTDKPVPAQPGAPPSVTIPGHVLAGEIQTRVTPSYPDSARVRRISGQVLLHADITEKGQVENIFPIASADDAFTDAAIAAVKQWRYRPYLLNGSPVRVDTTVTVNFYLNSGG